MATQCHSEFELMQNHKEPLVVLVSKACMMSFEWGNHFNYRQLHDHNRAPSYG